MRRRSLSCPRYTGVITVGSLVIALPGFGRRRKPTKAIWQILSMIVLLSLTKQRFASDVFQHACVRMCNPPPPRSDLLVVHCRYSTSMFRLSGGERWCGFLDFSPFPPELLMCAGRGSVGRVEQPNEKKKKRACSRGWLLMRPAPTGGRYRDETGKEAFFWGAHRGRCTRGGWVGGWVCCAITF